MLTKRTSKNPTEIAYANFAAFLNSSLAVDLIGTNSDAVLLVRELRKARLFHYYGIRTGKLSRQNMADRKKLHAYITRAYRGDPCGIAHWRRIASLLWRAFESVVHLQNWATRAARMKQQRAEHREFYRAKERARLRAVRARNRQLLDAQCVGATSPTLVRGRLTQSE